MPPFSVTCTVSFAARGRSFSHGGRRVRDGRRDGVREEGEGLDVGQHGVGAAGRAGSQVRDRQVAVRENVDAVVVAGALIEGGVGAASAGQRVVPAPSKQPIAFPRALEIVVVGVAKPVGHGTLLHRRPGRLDPVVAHRHILNHAHGHTVLLPARALVARSGCVQIGKRFWEGKTPARDRGTR